MRLAVHLPHQTIIRDWEEDLEEAYQLQMVVMHYLLEVGHLLVVMPQLLVQFLLPLFMGSTT
jgi:hypothetical protein